MNVPVKLILCLFALLMSAPRVAAEEWRGLVPLHSTRDDVARLFGECSNAERFCEFMLPNEEVRITLSSNELCFEGVPIHTILMIERQLQDGTTLTALGLEKRRFKSFNPWVPQDKNYRAYIDEQSGLILKSFQGEIFQINYIPPRKERRVCAGYYQKPREFAQVTPQHVPYVFIRCPKSSGRGRQNCYNRQLRTHWTAQLARMGIIGRANH